MVTFHIPALCSGCNEDSVTAFAELRSEQRKANQEISALWLRIPLYLNYQGSFDSGSVLFLHSFPTGINWCGYPKASYPGTDNQGKG